MNTGSIAYQALTFIPTLCRHEPNIEFPESRGDLAKILGTSPEVLCRLLAEFRKKGWIAVAGRAVTVKDKPRLEQFSRR
ncbi:MAG: helix-turn-helix domain-containing protein [Elusimicrobiota bacterium]|nr:helix-turn-helix domain-containing protein [Elusimicrobiota bacterium]